MKATDIRNSEAGSTTVEAAVIILPFFTIFFGMIQLALIAFDALSLQYAINKVSRWGTLGYSLEDSEAPGHLLPRGESIVKLFRDNSSRITLGIEDVEVYFCAVHNPECNDQGNPPGSQQWVVVRAVKPARVFFGLGTFAVSASVLTKNEPF